MFLYQSWNHCIEAFQMPNPHHVNLSSSTRKDRSSTSKNNNNNSIHRGTIHDTTITLYNTEKNEEDAKQYEYYRPQARKTPQGGDMSYIETNVRRNAETFKSIRQVGGAECTNDVYAKGTDRMEYWYIGKIARTTGTVTLQQGIARLWNIIEEHACRLRPVELGREFGYLEIWCSKKGDTELVMSQAMIDTPEEDFSLLKMEKVVEGSDQISNKEVGFIAEVVTNRGEGFYVIRDDQGKLMQ